MRRGLRSGAEPKGFVLGHQKSGTSAIAVLLAARSGVSVTNDLRREIGDQLIPRVLAGEVPFKRFLARNAHGFASTIVKHPNLTLLWPQLRDHFPATHYLFVVRDPRQTIRSILDRLQLPGDVPSLSASDWHRLPLPWQSILAGQGVHSSLLEGLDYVEVLAERWNHFANHYLAHPDAILARYEDFLLDKVGEITRLSEALGLRPRFAIDTLVDRQFQPKGTHHGIEPVDFFGSKRLQKLVVRCGAKMTLFGYE